MVLFKQKQEKKEVIDVKTVTVDKHEYTQVYFRDREGRVTMGALKKTAIAPTVGEYVFPLDICIVLSRVGEK